MRRVPLTSSWTRRLAAILVGSLVVPVAVEFVLALIKGESYNLGRAATVVGVVGLISLLLYLSRPSAFTFRLSMAVFLLAAGIMLALYGFLVASIDQLFSGRIAHSAVGAISVCIGLIVGSIGVYALGEAWRQQPPTAAVPDQAQPPKSVSVKRFVPYRPEAHQHLVEACRARLSPDDLHYVAFYAGHECVFRVDIFDDPALGTFHGLVEASARRAAYDAQGPAVEEALESFNRTYRDLDVGILIRLVLDVERGAVYYFTIDRDTGRYLLAVTLDQEQVHHTDTKVARLVDDLRHALGFPRMTELEQHR